MIKIFSPFRIETPFPWMLKSESFGMGKKKAEQFAHELEGCSYETILVIGSSGALRPHLKPGDTFFVSEIVSEAETIKIPQRFSGPSARLYTSARIIADPNEKIQISERLNADIVDMEMGFLWTAASESLRKKFVFVRGVLDASGHELDFKKASTWLRLPGQIHRYRLGMRSFLRDHIFRR